MPDCTSGLYSLWGMPNETLYDARDGELWPVALTGIEYERRRKQELLEVALLGSTPS